MDCSANMELVYVRLATGRIQIHGGWRTKNVGRLQNSNMQRLTLPTELNWVWESAYHWRSEVTPLMGRLMHLIISFLLNFMWILSELVFEPGNKKEMETCFWIKRSLTQLQQKPWTWLVLCLKVYLNPFQSMSHSPKNHNSQGHQSISHYF